MSDLKRLQSQLEQLERSYKLGIISEDEYKKGKDNLEKKSAPLKEEQKKSEESKKIISEVLEDKSEKKEAKKPEKKQEPKKTKKKAQKPAKKQTEEKPKTEKKTKKTGQKKAESQKEKTKKSEKKPAKKKEPRESKGSIWAGLIIILIVIVLFFMFGNPEQEVDTSIGEKNLTGINQTVELTYFGSFACQYCEDTEQVMRSVKSAYGDNVNIHRIYYPYNIEVDFEMDKAAECAQEQGKYDNYSMMLYTAKKPVSEEELIGFAQELGMNTTQFEECMQSNATAERVLRDYEQAIEMEIEEIPTIIIDGASITGARPGIIYETIIDDELY